MAWTRPGPGVILYLDIQAAAMAVSMSPRWIRLQIGEGLPVLRTAGKILISPEDLRAWMERRYREKQVDINEAVRMAEELTAGRSRRKGAR